MAQTIWTFRIERYDDAGNRVALVPVEMRGLHFEGSLANGDRVRAWGRFRGGTFRATEIENWTTGTRFRSRRIPGVAALLIGIFFAAVVGFIGWIAYTGLTSDPGPPAGVEMPAGAPPGDPD
jgi:hypothetical protein